MGKFPTTSGRGNEKRKTIQREMSEAEGGCRSPGGAEGGDSGYFFTTLTLTVAVTAEPSLAVTS